MRLFLVRHGQTAWNLAGRAQGQTDVPLDEVGLAQRDRLGSAFLGVRLSRIYSSDLLRASQTAEALVKATGAPIEFSRELRERGFGEWEGQSFIDLLDWSIAEADRLGVPRIAVRPPGGESYLDLWERTSPILDRIVEAGETCAIVSHGGTCSVLLAQLVRGTPETARAFRFGNTAIYELKRREDGYFRIDRFNDTRHLDIEIDDSPGDADSGDSMSLSATSVR
jgi:probable phosphoglycerate mutase